ncbi:MAG: hypothetical protein ACFFDC_20350 [Promethearchaeota archaeon]
MISLSTIYSTKSEKELFNNIMRQIKEFQDSLSGIIIGGLFILLNPSFNPSSAYPLPLISLGLVVEVI